MIFLSGLFLASFLSLIAEKAITGNFYLKKQELVPVLSWTLHNHRLIELFFALSLVFATKWYSGSRMVWVASGLAVAWLSVLTDIYEGTIYDIFTLPFAAAFLVVSGFSGELASSAAGAAAGFIFAAVFSTVKRMGSGDATLLLFFGAWLGLHGLVRSAALGSLVAGVAILVLLIMKKINMQSALPFAPVMFVGAVLHFLI